MHGPSSGQPRQRRHAAERLAGPALLKRQTRSFVAGGQTIGQTQPACIVHVVDARLVTNRRSDPMLAKFMGWSASIHGGEHRMQPGKGAVGLGRVHFRGKLCP